MSAEVLRGKVQFAPILLIKMVTINFYLYTASMARLEGTVSINNIGAI
jgi:hypothetical protein